MKNKEISFVNRCGWWTSDTYRVTLCDDSFRKYFEIPADVHKIALVFSQRKLKESYKMELSMRQSDYRFEHNINISDARKSWRPALSGYSPSLLVKTRRLFIHLWDQGYNYVRCEYNG